MTQHELFGQDMPFNLVTENIEPPIEDTKEYFETPFLSFDGSESNISQEIKINCVRECPSVLCDHAERCVDYWNQSVVTSNWFNPEREQLIVALLNTRLRVTGHSIVSIGTLSETMCHPRDVFRPAIALNAYAILLMHNHPSGDPAPSQMDARLTRHLKEGAHLLSIYFADHVIVGDSTGGRCPYFSFKEAGIL